jgi:hypothetical protein
MDALGHSYHLPQKTDTEYMSKVWFSINNWPDRQTTPYRIAMPNNFKCISCLNMKNLIVSLPGNRAQFR